VKELELSKLTVFADDLCMLLERMQQGTLATLDEHIEVAQEIHELERILADCELFVHRRIAERFWLHTAGPITLHATLGEPDRRRLVAEVLDEMCKLVRMQGESRP
jgi:hypothetical protein